MEIGTGLVCAAAFTPLTPEPLSPEYRGEGRYGFEERMGGACCLLHLELVFSICTEM